MRYLLIVAVSLALSSIVLAQNARNGAERISGQWQQYGQTLLDLKGDGKGAVTGTVYFRRGTERFSAEVKIGRFDSERNTLRLEGTIRLGDSADTFYTIDGVLEGDMLRAKYAFGRDTGEATLTRSS
jgi:hypothetical protein